MATSALAEHCQTVSDVCLCSSSRDVLEDGGKISDDVVQLFSQFCTVN